MKHLVVLVLATLTSLGFAGISAQDKDAVAKLEKQRAPKPAEFAIVFSNGYASDLMPTDDARFEDLLKSIKSAEFNVIHCTYAPRRLELCKKHGIKMMVDLLADEHVFKAPEKAQALCEKLRGNSDVWGYNIWNDSFGKTGPGRRRDINNVRTWDPTHPAYCGTYRTIGLNHLVNADVMGYYDFHWKRGIDKHFPHLLAFSNMSRDNEAGFYSWLSATSGFAGKGNFNRNLYSANTGIACGMKGYFWFIGGDLMNPKTLEWTEIGRDLIEVNKEVAPLRAEIARFGMPLHLYTTPITKTANDKPLPDGKKEMPPGLDKHGFPANFWLQPAGGEFVLGIFQDAPKRDFAFLANHNAYAPQQAVLQLGQPRAVEIFQRKKGEWQVLPVKDKTVRLSLDPGAGELLRFGK